MILARELGIPLTFDDIIVEPLATRREVSNWLALEDVFKEEDEALKIRQSVARSNGNVLRFVQRIDCSPAVELGKEGVVATASVRLEEVPIGSVHAQVQYSLYLIFLLIIYMKIFVVFVGVWACVPFRLPYGKIRSKPVDRTSK